MNRLFLAGMLVLVGCTSKSNDYIISECKKCTDAGLEAKLQWAEWGVVGVTCVPKEEKSK